MTDFSTMRTICFTGPRPNKLYGYKNKEKYQKLVDCIHDFLRGFCRIESDEILTVITGGAQGIDQLAFWAANSLKKEYSLKNECIFHLLVRKNSGMKQVCLAKKNIER